MRVTDLPAQDRPRERLIARGAESLSERELLALVLGKGRQGESALELRRLVEPGGDLVPEQVELARVGAPAVGVRAEDDATDAVRSEEAVLDALRDDPRRCAFRGLLSGA